MRVRIYHREDDALSYVANIKYPGESIDVALDYAWAHSQNINGSWSRGEFIGERRNPDYSPDVVRIAALPEHNGKVYGLRSSMVGDVFVIGAQAFRVASSGFESCEAPE